MLEQHTIIVTTPAQTKMRNKQFFANKAAKKVPICVASPAQPHMSLLQKHEPQMLPVTLGSRNGGGHGFTINRCLVRRKQSLVIAPALVTYMSTLGGKGASLSSTNEVSWLLAPLPISLLIVVTVNLMPSPQCACIAHTSITTLSSGCPEPPPSPLSPPVSMATGAAAVNVMLEVILPVKVEEAVV